MTAVKLDSRSTAGSHPGKVATPGLLLFRHPRCSADVCPISERANGSRAAVGFTVKSGWAAVVLLSALGNSRRVADSRRIDLSDPAIPESRQPYHAGFGTARQHDRELTRLLDSVRRFGRRSVLDVIAAHAAAGHALAGVGIVVGSLTDPSRIANDHIRIHALEGQLFREVVEQGAAERGLRRGIWRERDLFAAATGVLGQSEQRIRAATAALGRDVEGSWRAEQKAATVAAWLILAGG
jgi:hypothetical protein